MSRTVAATVLPAIWNSFLRTKLAFRGNIVDFALFRLSAPFRVGLTGLSGRSWVQQSFAIWRAVSAQGLSARQIEVAAEVKDVDHPSGCKGTGAEAGAGTDISINAKEGTVPGIAGMMKTEDMIVRTVTYRARTVARTEDVRSHLTDLWETVIDHSTVDVPTRIPPLMARQNCRAYIGTSAVLQPSHFR